MDPYPLIGLIGFCITWYFTSFYLTVISTILLLIGLARSWPQEFNYHLKIWTFNIVFILSTIIYLPYFLVYPFHDDNLGKILIFWRLSMNIYRIKVEPRDVENSLTPRPAVILANHQSSLDLLSLVNSLPPRTVILAKKEIKYLGSFGLSAYLCNTIFVDRFNRDKAINTMTGVAETMNRKKVNVLIYPEGTRNMNGSLLPFKKGAFHLAIQAQAPIIPIVSSSYSSFLDHEKRRFDSGGKVIIKCLPPIETKGLTTKDVDSLTERVRDEMLKVFLELSTEIMHENSAYDHDSNPTPAKVVPLAPMETSDKANTVLEKADSAMANDGEKAEKRVMGVDEVNTDAQMSNITSKLLPKSQQLC